MVVKKRKKILALFFILILFSTYLIASDGIPDVRSTETYTVSREFAFDYDSIYQMQKQIDSLDRALNACLSTILYAKEKFSSEENAEYLLKRIYTKMDLASSFSEEDPVFTAIISESTEELLTALNGLEEATTTYAAAYPVTEFVVSDFSHDLEHFRFETFKRYLSLNKLIDYNLVDKISGDQLKNLTSHLIDTFKNNKIYIGNELYNQLIVFGGEKFINYLSIQISPFINANDEESYKEQLSLLNTYVNLYKLFYQSDFDKKIPPENYNYYYYLTEYYDYLEDVEILSNRFITTEATTLNTLSQIFVNYLKKYNDIKIKTDLLDEKVQEMIKNASTRIVYTAPEIRDSYRETNNIALKNQELQETLNNFTKTLSLDTEATVSTTESGNILESFMAGIKGLENNLVLMLLLIFLIPLLIYFLLPLKTKGIIMKNIGLRSKALAIFQKASIQKPMDADIHIKTAQIYEKMGRDEEAINEYKIASKVIDMKGD